MAKQEPQRSCLGCRTVKDKKDLLRFVLAPDRTLVPDPQAKLPGRGAYTCWQRECLRTAAAKNQFARSFRGEVRSAVPDDLVARVVQLLDERIGAYLALANKAGKVVSGSDMVVEAFKRRTPGVLFVAADISAESRERFVFLADRAGVPLVELFTKEKLGALLGKEMRGVAAIEQGGFSTTIVAELEKYRNFVREGCSNHE
jgi:predicted RNA-binding protein YlxR (DUF448 family)